MAVAIESGLTSSTEMNLYPGEAIIEACANLITVEDDLVVPVHFTVQEFLTAPRRYAGLGNRTIGEEYQIFPPDAHAELAGYCIQYLLFTDITHQWITHRLEVEQHFALIT